MSIDQEALIESLRDIAEWLDVSLGSRLDAKIVLEGIGEIEKLQDIQNNLVVLIERLCRGDCSQSALGIAANDYLARKRASGDIPSPSILREE